MAAPPPLFVRIKILEARSLLPMDLNGCGRAFFGMLFPPLLLTVRLRAV